MKTADATEAASIADDLAGWLADPAFGSIPADARRRAWEALVQRFPATGKYAHDAGVWYLERGADPSAAARFLVEAVRAEPSNEVYRKDLARVPAAVKPAR